MTASSPRSSKGKKSQRSKPAPVQLSPQHIAELRQSGLTEAQAIATSHRTVDAKQAQKATSHKLPGLLFTYRNPLTGKPYEVLTGKWAKRPFCRLKPDWSEATDGDRDFYTDEDGDRPKYLSPKNCGNRPYFSPLMDWKRVINRSAIPLVLTEGEKKGDAGCASGIATIAGAGVSAFVDRNSRGEWTGGSGSAWDCDEPEDGEAVSRFLPELEDVYWKGRSVGICFDSDIVSKSSVRRAMETLLAHTRARAGRGFPILLPSEIDGSKNGLDDFIARHGSKAFALLFDAFQSIQSTNKKMVVYKKEKTGGTRVRGPEIPLPEEGQRELRCFLTLKEPPNHVKALMAWSVLKEDWAYRPGLGWYRWNGKHWAIAGDSMELSAEIARFFDVQNWQDRSGALYAYTMDEIARRTILPEKLWNSADLLSFENGTLNAKTNQFGPHNRQDYCTSILPYGFEPEAPCPNWMKFLRQATGNDEPLQTVIQAWFRWCLTPKQRDRKSDVEKSWDIVGRKGSGKGTALDILMSLIGEENCGSASPETFGSPEGLGSLIDKKIAIDTDTTGYMSGVGNFNKVVSNEAVSVKKLFKDKATLRLGVVIVRSYNDYISIPSSGTEGLDRRLCITPFNHPPKEPDYDLSEKLQAELPGIFAWAWSMSVATAKAVIRWSGSVGAVQQASVDRFCNDHPEYRFLLDEFPAGHDCIQAYDLYERYSSWAKRNGHKPCSNTKFGTLMNELGLFHHKGNGGCIFYTLPAMEKKFDLLGYLRISPGDPTGMPVELRPKNSSNPEPEKLSEGSEGFGGLVKPENPEPIKLSEGSEGLAPKSLTINTGNSTAPPSPGDVVLIVADAYRYNRDSSDLPDEVPWRERNTERMHLSSLPNQLLFLLTGESEVLDILKNGTQVRVQCCADAKMMSVFDIDAVRVLRRAKKR